MNQNLLTSEAQSYLESNSKELASKIALSKSPIKDVTPSELAEQIDSQQRLSSKLPNWLGTKNIYYPPRRNAEQCSSEATAQHKAQLVKGDKAIDLTGGFGVDAYVFSQYFKTVDYCEMDEVLFPIVEHNMKQLNTHHVNCHFGNSIDYLKQNNDVYDLIYLDPHRRDKHNRKMVGFADCAPNVVELLDLLFSKSSTLMVKASPMMDISRAVQELSHVEEVHVISLKNECKELLFILNKDFEGETRITATNILKDSKQTIHFYKSEEQESFVQLGEIATYIYEPNSAVLKSGAFNIISSKYGVDKLHSSTHIYTSDKKIENFPGKRYKVNHVVDYNKKAVAKVLTSKQINVKTYNFSHTPQLIQKKLGLKDGGSQFLFGIKDMNDKYRLIIAETV